jgi:histidinol-phosphatase (PHP family)
VNTGAISRGYRKEPYPTFPYLKSLRENGNLVLLSSDSHHRDTLLYQFNLAKELVHAAGFVTAGFVDGNGTEHIQF